MKSGLARGADVPQSSRAKPQKQELCKGLSTIVGHAAGRLLSTSSISIYIHRTACTGICAENHISIHREPSAQEAARGVIPPYRDGGQYRKLRKESRLYIHIVPPAQEATRAIHLPYHTKKYVTNTYKEPVSKLIRRIIREIIRTIIRKIVHKIIRGLIP